jgi:hypothetical protein
VCQTCAALLVLEAARLARLAISSAVDRRSGCSASTSAAIQKPRIVNTSASKYISKTIHIGLRVTQALLNRMLAERDLCFLAQTTSHSRKRSEIIDLCRCTAEVMVEVPRFDAIEGVQEGAEKSRWPKN